MMSDNIKKLIATFETERKKIHKTVVILLSVGWSVFGVCLVVLLVCMVLGAPAIIGYIMLPLVLAGLIVGIIGLNKKNAFTKSVVRRLQAEINEELFPGATYAAGGLPIKTILKPGFFAPPDRWYTKNYMSATYKGITFEESHYQLQRREEHSDSHGNVHTTYVDYAVGAMYHFLYDRNFGGVLKVLEKSGFAFGSSKGLPKYETEYISFNNKFNVYASDQQLVFYILTPQLQEKVMDLESSVAGRFYMAFMDNEMFIALDGGDDTVRIPFDKPITEDSMLRVVAYMSIPAVFINLLGLSKAKFEANAGVNFKN